MGFMMILFWVVVIAIIAFAVRSTNRPRGDAPAHGALDVLEERYARGEIDDDEFQRRKKLLQES
jgi:putative membrane protein